MENLQVIEYADNRVLTTQQLANGYEVKPSRITDNFNSNKSRYSENKHYYCLEGDELRAFKDDNGNSVVVDRASKLYLWTERGALLHAKSLNTDRAWEVYDTLVETYFKAQDVIKSNNDNLPMEIQALKSIVNTIEKLHFKVEELEEKTQQSNNTLNEIKNILTKTDPSWRQTAKRKINQVVSFTRKSYPEIVNESYEMLRNSAGCNLTTRLEHMKERMYKQGLSHSQVKAINIMDVIEVDAKLKSWYTEVINKLVIKYIVGNEVTA